jgi:exopolysaccharide biosynthesis protein
MASIMEQLGAIDALNLDGGGSTTLYLGGQLLEHPPRIVPRVHNGLGIFIEDPAANAGKL